MIALLTGRLAHKSPDAIIIDVNGVGYRVQIPFSTYYELPEEGKTVSLSIHTHVKEDSISLFGFRTLAEKEFFQLLISVSGIGPKMARDILSNIQPEELAAAIVQGNLVRLSSIPGIGKKTAERLVLELKEKVRKMDVAPSAQEAPSSEAPAEVADDVASALVNLGYKEAVVRKVLAEMSIEPDASTEAVLRQALKVLMK
ncbi:Holliday junction branch migration protein RuvA [Geobacter sulfurreducens]|jgi:Holliday junction DNA helicase RuvA|uniref:Holliday junction branch migration complex subunit RuvA n=1 Tax=Geobacter sulfurreducens (strain ATCC 51573 / DSM 12127 / PCA) TaxID=243231 RepID=RUVA_GEOSL|nr:Holliday junction branch migration protein RuvA [Geobacter sulfurreducens]Q74E87.1 RecName: Full=Holliday junction branch migration complex subunit RuvA [Geobacter sulfurreducens PCA]AAR34402.1 Holliday junction DNA helicase RuvA [Geobacter sulfurreducens PCA]ADI83915.1 Holliday junction DNA helicase RuvA [Geobacter sulfurreducens KN400]AJY70798.1 ATP-dependent DNA helicase RuvA [Geobacter sulfurreducens]UAC05121.1 Holliday junction branch migration protein RuvA [Geobacter sulfurreducens]U